MQHKQELNNLYFAEVTVTSQILLHTSECCFFLSYLNFVFFPAASNIVLMSAKAVLVDFGLTVQMKDDVYVPRDLRGTEVSMFEVTLHTYIFPYLVCHSVVTKC